VNFRTLLALASASFALGACGGGGDIDESVGGTAIISFSALPNTPSGDFSVEEAWVSLHWLELVPCSDDVGALGDGDFPIKFFYDPPPQMLFGTGVLNYCGLRLEVRPSDSNTALDGFSALVRGTRGDGAPVVIESVVETEISVSGPSFNVSSVVLGFDFDAWLAGVDLDAAELDDEGAVRIDAEHNIELLAAFHAGLASAPAVYQDYDRDGYAGEDELTPVATPE
jgi:hypothetical protein